MLLHSTLGGSVGLGVLICKMELGQHRPRELLQRVQTAHLGKRRARESLPLPWVAVPLASP